VEFICNFKLDFNAIVMLFHLWVCRNLNILIEKPVVHQADDSRESCRRICRLFSGTWSNRALKNEPFSNHMSCLPLGRPDSMIRQAIEYHSLKISPVRYSEMTE